MNRFHTRHLRRRHRNQTTRYRNRRLFVEQLENRRVLAAVSLLDGNLLLGNAGSEDNAISISFVDDTRLLVREANHELVAGKGVTGVDANSVSVPLEEVNQISLLSASAQPPTASAAASSTFTINFGPADDDIALQLDTSGNLLITGWIIGDITLSGFDLGILNGEAGNDSLTVDFVNGNPIPVDGLEFNGGTQSGTPGDTLVLQRGSFSDVVSNHDNAHDGNIVLDGSRTITYTGLEPITSTLTATNITINLPNVANPDATLSNSAVAGQTELTGSTFEDFIFNNPTGSLTINGGTAADTIAVRVWMRRGLLT